MAPPSNQTVHHRKIGSVPFVKGGRQSLELDRDGVLLGLSIRLKFDYNNGAAGPAGPKFQTLARLIKRLEVIAGGRDTVWSISGAALSARVQYEKMVPAYGMDTTVSLANGATGTYDIVLPMDFVLPNGRRPDDTGLDTRGLGQLALYITWGQESDLFTTVNNFAISNVVCSVEGQYMLNIPDGRVYLVRALDTTERELTGSSDNWDLTMDRGTGLVYRTFMVTATADDIGVNTILDSGSIRIESGSFIFQNRDAVQIRGANRHNIGMNNILAGVYFVDCTFDGQLVNGINTGGLDSDLKAIFNATKVAGTNFISVQREAVRPLKLA